MQSDRLQHLSVEKLMICDLVSDLPTYIWRKYLNHPPRDHTPFPSSYFTYTPSLSASLYPISLNSLYPPPPHHRPPLTTHVGEKPTVFQDQ